MSCYLYSLDSLHSFGRSDSLCNFILSKEEREDVNLNLTEMHLSELFQLLSGNSERFLHDNPVNYLSTRGCGQTSLICHPLSCDNIGNFNSGNMLSCSLEDLESFNIQNLKSFIIHELINGHELHPQHGWALNQHLIESVLLLLPQPEFSWKKRRPIIH